MVWKLLLDRAGIRRYVCWGCGLRSVGPERAIRLVGTADFLHVWCAAGMVRRGVGAYVGPGKLVGGKRI